MKVQHKNSGEILDLSYPVYYKHNSVYGLLIMTIKEEIFFIEDAENDDFTDVTNEFKIL